MTAGYSGTPLAKKLGIKPASRICVRNAPSGYREMLAPLPADVSFTREPTRADIVHLFTSKRAELVAQLKELRTTIADDAALWISWPKRSSKLPTDITEDTIREECLPLGFVDIKVCAVDDTWSGLKLVIRKELREAANGTTAKSGTSAKKRTTRK